MKNPLRNIAYLEPDPERKQYRSFFSQHAVLFPLLAFLLFLLITAGISRYLEKENEAKLKARLVLTANQTAHRLEDYLRIHFNVIRFLRDHIVNDPFPAPEDFAAEVEDIMGQFAGFQAINYVNAQGVIEQVVPYRPNLLALGKDLHTHPMAAPYFKKAEQTHLDVCTDQVRLYQGGKGFATYFPIIQNGRVSGYLNGVFRIEQFLGPLFLNHTTPNYYFFLQDAKGQLVLDNSDDHSLRYDPLAEIRKIPFLDHAWTLTVTPNPVLVSQTRTRGSLLVFFLGTAASVILSWLYRITLVRQRKLYATMDTIRKEEENYRELIDNSPFGMGVFRDGKFIYINDAGVRLVGAASAKQFLNTPLEDIVHVDDQKGLVDQVGELVRHPRKTQPLEVKLVRLDNQVIDVELDASQILFEGEPATLVVARDITDRKQAEQARKESETWYRTLFESATDAIFIMSRDRFIDCNQRTLEMFGCRREDIIEQPPWKFSPVIQYDQRPSKEAALEKINAAYAGIPQSFEWLHCKLDGTLFDAHVNLNRVVIAGDEYLLATVRDISMEKRVEKVSAVTYQIAEATVLTSDIDALYQMIHEKLSLILDTTNIYIALVDLDRKQVSFPYFVDQYDTPPESMPLKRGLTDYVLSLGRPLLVRQQELARLIREGTIVMEGTRPKVWLGAPLVTEKRKIGVIALQNYEDETVYTEADMEILNFVSDQIAIAIDRKRAETDRLRQQTYFQQLFNNSPQGIVILNKQDEILNINKGFEDLFQYTREELVGKKLAYHIVPDRLKEESTRYSERVFKDEVVRTETVRKRKDGSEIHVSILAFPIQFGDEDPAIYAIYSDITDRVRYQEDLQASEARFRTLANELSAMNDMKETLLDVISHDLRNPAGVIFSMTDLMVQEDPDSEALQLLKTSSEDLLSVIENATSLSRVAFGEDIQKESLDLAQLIPRIVQDFGPELKRNGLEVDVDLPDSLEIQANRLVSEIFKNYLSNAIKYAAHGKRIQIVGVREPHSVTVEVRDFGTTIPGDQLQSIFTRGVRLEGGKKKGRGLGLAIVKRIAEVHNGEVGVRPNSPKGNIFYVTLPVK